MALDLHQQYVEASGAETVGRDYKYGEEMLLEDECSPMSDLLIPFGVELPT